MPAPHNSPSPRLVMQRIRNRIIQHLQLVASFEEQLEYQKAVPRVHVPHEIINRWEDLVNSDTLRMFASPVFTADELTAIEQFNAAWNVAADQTPDYLPSLEELFLTAAWKDLRDAAASAQSAFEARGLLTEDDEIV